MRRALIVGIGLLLVTVLIGSGAQAATQVRQAQFEAPVPTAGVPGTPSPGAITLDFAFKNKRAQKKTFTPRQLTRIALSKIRLTCSNPSSQFFLTATFDSTIKLKKAPPPHANKPKPGRYAFRFFHSFSVVTGGSAAFTGTISGTIDKPNGRSGPTPPRAHGELVIDDFDADPGHQDCATTGPLGWSDPSLTRL